MQRYFCMNTYHASMFGVLVLLMSVPLGASENLRFCVFFSALLHHSGTTMAF